MIRVTVEQAGGSDRPYVLLTWTNGAPPDPADGRRVAPHYEYPSAHDLIRLIAQLSRALLDVRNQTRVWKIRQQQRAAGTQKSA